MEAIQNIQGKTIGFCGAGGKTTSIFFIAQQLINIKEKVLITTTTKMYPESKFENIAVVIRETFLIEDLNERDGVLWFSKVDQENKGLAPKVDEIAALNNYTNIWKLIEIDGSKHLPIKAPRIGEPVYPQGLSHLFGVIGARAFGQPANENIVHRLPEFLGVTALKVGETISPEAVAKLIQSPQGLFRDKPEGLSCSILLTQVEAKHTAFIKRLRTLTSVPIEVMPWID